MDDGFNFPDVTQEFVPQTFTLGGTFNKTCDVTEFNGGINGLSGVIYFMKLGYPLVRHCNDTDIRLYGAERIVGSLSACLGYCVEQRTLAYIWQAYDT